MASSKQRVGSGEISVWSTEVLGAKVLPTERLSIPHLTPTGGPWPHLAPVRSFLG